MKYFEIKKDNERDKKVNRKDEEEGRENTKNRIVPTLWKAIPVVVWLRFQGDRRKKRKRNGRTGRKKKN